MIPGSQTSILTIFCIQVDERLSNLMDRRRSISDYDDFSDSTFDHEPALFMRVSASKKRRKRRKKLRSTFTNSPLSPEQPQAAGVPALKNNFGIVSVKRCDSTLFQGDDLNVIIRCLEKNRLFVIRDHMSLCKNTLQIFCGSRHRLHRVWDTLNNYSDLSGQALPHPGFCAALPGLEFSHDMKKIECRLPYNFLNTYSKSSAAISGFLVGTPEFTPSHVKFLKCMNLRHAFNPDKQTLLILEVTDELYKHIKSVGFLTKFGKTKRKVKWTLTKKQKETKEYRKAEDAAEYWKRKRKISLNIGKGTTSSCFDYRIMDSSTG